MDNSQLDKYFSTQPDSEESLDAYVQLRLAGREMAEVVNRLVPESPGKADLLGRLFRIVVDAELAVRMDGVSRTQNMIVLTKQ